MQSPSTSTCLMDGFRCRLCFKSSDHNLQPLFPPGDECFVNDLLSQIYDCLTIHVSFLEDFCSVICSECRDKINSFYTFKKQCQSNDGYLREKRSREMTGVEVERNTKDLNTTNSEVEASCGKVKEPKPEELIEQTESIFFPGKENETKSWKLVQRVDVGTQMDPEVVLKCSKLDGETVEKVDVAVQMCGTSSQESFRGFSDEFYARRSPRIFIKNSVTEAFEMITAPSTANDDIQKCQITIEKLDIKPEIPVQLPEVDEIKPLVIPKEKRQKKVKTTPIAKNFEQAPRLLRQKAVLFFDGFEYRKPRTCHDGTTDWVCCKISCPATLEQKADGKLKLNAKHKQHLPQVVRDTVVLDRKSRKLVPVMVTNNNHKRKVICDDAFRYRLSTKMTNGQTVWACDAQPAGCKAFLRVWGDFRAVSKVFQHNHAETIMVRRRKAAQKEKLPEKGERKPVKQA